MTVNLNCNCHLGSAAHCPIHTRADFDAQRPTREVTEQGLRDFASKMLNLGWEYGQGFHNQDGAFFQMRRYLREFFDVN
jgi:hypothetical protein